MSNYYKLNAYYYRYFFEIIFKIDLPENLINEVVKCKSNSEIREVGINWCIKQSKELMNFGSPVIHYYSMGKSSNIKEIAKALF